MKKIVYIIFLLLSIISFGENYNVGDKITLKISGKIDRTEIEKIFKDYKLFSITEDENSKIIEFTTYNIGKNNILIGNKKLKFETISTIEPNENKIYEELENKKNQYVELDYPHKGISFILIGFIIVILSIIAFIILRVRDPYFIFNKSIAEINDKNWKEKISFSIRKYIDSVYKTNFLNGEYIKVSTISDEDIKFIYDMDYLKFAPNKEVEFNIYKDRAIEIVERLRKEQKNNV